MAKVVCMQEDNALEKICKELRELKKYGEIQWKSEKEQ